MRYACNYTSPFPQDQFNNGFSLHTNVNCMGYITNGYYGYQKIIEDKVVDCTEKTVEVMDTDAPNTDETKANIISNKRKLKPDSNEQAINKRIR